MSERFDIDVGYRDPLDRRDDVEEPRPNWRSEEFMGCDRCPRNAPNARECAWCGTRLP